MGFEYEFEFSVKNKNRSVNVDLFDLSHKFKNGEKGKKANDPFDVFNREDEGSLQDPFKELDGF